MAFYYLTKLSSLTIGNSVTSIGGGAFMGCSGITGNLIIPNSVTSIGDNAFQSCSSISGLTLGNSVTTIGNEAFSGCSGISGSLTFPNSVTTIGGSAFYCCNHINIIYCSNETPPTLGPYAFTGDVSVTNAFVPTFAAVTAYKATSWISYFQGNKININYPTAVNDLSINNIKVYATAGGISIEGLDAGEKLTLYTVNGVQLQTLKSEGTLMVLPALPNALYLVKTTGKVFKVIL